MVKVCQRTSGYFADAMSLRPLAMCALLFTVVYVAGVAVGGNVSPASR
jgi:hypothetical protein